MPFAPLTPEEEVSTLAHRVLEQFCAAFEAWWRRLDGDTQGSLLETAVSDNEFFSERDAERIRKGTRDAVPICQFVSAIAAEYGFQEFDAKTVRQYRNELSHRSKTERGTLKFMQVHRVEEFVDACTRLVKHFGAVQEHAQIAGISDYLLHALTGRLQLHSDAGHVAEGGTALAPAPPAAPPTTSGPGEPAPRPTGGRPAPPKPPRIAEAPFQLPSYRRSAKAAVGSVPALQHAALSPDQRDAVDLVVDWFHAGGKVQGERRPLSISGPAGSGKTTVLSVIIAELGLVPQHVMLLAPTGKAVEALKVRLPRGWKKRVGTLAGFLWRWQLKGYEGEDASFANQGTKPLATDLSLLIVDEASMVTKKDHAALLRYARVLFIGDPDQLPPVVEDPSLEGELGSCGVLEQPDTRLAKVHRQSEGSSILSVADQVRGGQQPAFGPSGDGNVIHLSEELGHLGVDVLRELVDEADVVLTQRNSLRVRINEYVRWRRGHMKNPIDYVPKAGEVLVASENAMHPTTRTRVANGERLIVQEYLGTVQVRDDAPEIEEYRVRAYPEGREVDSADWVISSQMLRGDQIRSSVLDTRHVSGPRSSVLRADWGYALTVHKAQGSEWPNVMVVDDQDPDHHVPRNKWYYVAYSRAIDRLVILKVRRDTLLFGVEWVRR